MEAKLTTKAVVYFIECAGFIKIGYSARVEERMAQMSTGNPFPLNLIGTVEGTYNLERALQRLAHKHIYRNEWFVDCPEVRDLISKVMRDGAGSIDIDLADLTCFDPLKPDWTDVDLEPIDEDMLKQLDAKGYQDPDAGRQITRMILRAVLPVKIIGKRLAQLTGFSEQSCARYAAGKREPNGTFVVALFHSPMGRQFLFAFMAGCKARWWQSFKKVFAFSDLVKKGVDPHRAYDEVFGVEDALELLDTVRATQASQRRRV